MTRTLATSVTRMARARSTRDFARGRCEAEDVERAVARRMFLQALRYWRPAVAPGGAKANATRIRAPPTISEETASRLHVVERGKKNVRVSRASCVEWSDARESVFMVCGRRPRRVLKLRSRKTESPSFITRLCCLLLKRMSARIRAPPTISADTPSPFRLVNGCFQRTRRRQKPD